MEENISRDRKHCEKCGGFLLPDTTLTKGVYLMNSSVWIVADATVGMRAGQRNRDHPILKTRGLSFSSPITGSPSISGPLYH